MAAIPSALTAESLEAVANEIAAEGPSSSSPSSLPPPPSSGIVCRVGTVDCYTRPADGRRASTFRVHYERKRAAAVEGCECGDPHSSAPADEFAVVDRAIAKELHGTLLSRIESAFPGASVRL